jgi:UDP-N-acetylmuramoyl-L-alanyl-D-glutamate--2,6-diaminopimelate ligase
MKLRELLDGFIPFQKEVLSKIGDRLVTGLALDSREIKAGQVFIAVAGAQQHGLSYASQVMAKGAIAIFYDPLDDTEQLADSLDHGLMIAVDELNVKLGDIAARYYGDPSVFLDVIGITGTNGKTSCSQFLSQALKDCGIIGTLGWGEWGNLKATLNTTSNALETQRILAALKEDNKTAVAMEVSSHGLAQGRVNGIYFRGAVFTNISRDHLDYHGTMEAYLQTKLLLLTKPGLKFVVINLDDPYSNQIIKAVPQHVVIWGVSLQGRVLSLGESVVANVVSHRVDGVEFEVTWRDFRQSVCVPLYGDFNIENSLVVLAVLLAMDMSLIEAVKKLEHLKPVIGRMERFGADEEEPLVFVDYAHTPDALNKVLSSLKKHCQRDLWVVFGCGGNRDKGKRPEMGRIAEYWADHVVVTDDNPRFEDSLVIVNEILAGCESPINADFNGKVIVNQCRDQAIQSVILNADKRDCIVIAGKGHECYQEVKGVKTPFSDSQSVIDALKMRAELR